MFFYGIMTCYSSPSQIRMWSSRVSVLKWAVKIIRLQMQQLLLEFAATAEKRKKRTEVLFKKFVSLQLWLIEVFESITMFRTTLWSCTFE